MVAVVEKKQIALTANYKARVYQRPFWKAMHNGCKRAVKVWHRRSGKDTTDLCFTIDQMAERVGIYHYFFPTHTMGRKVLWDGIDYDGNQFLDHFPKEFISKKNESQMKITTVNSSIFQVIGTDRLDNVGTNPVGCVFSEYSLQNPKGWELSEPILSENGGWAVFNFTPRGKNHGHRIYRMAQTNKDWFCELLTIDDTKAISLEAIDAERRSGMSEALIKREYYCSFESGQEGSFYNDVLNALYGQGRITNEISYHAGLPVHTVCDPGYHWPWAFFQVRGNEPVFLRAYEVIGLGVEKHAEILERYKKEYGYRYGQHFAPIDTEKNNAYRAVAGKSIYEHAKENGINFTILEPEFRVSEGIERTRHFLYGCWFIKDDCELLLDALQAYCSTKVERHTTEFQPVFTGVPEPNWSVHLADTIRYASMVFGKGLCNPSNMSKQRWRQLKAQYA